MFFKRNPPVIVFSTPSCGFCHLTKRYLQQHHIRFQEIDISQNLMAANDMVMRSGQRSVPVLDIGGQIIVGFNRPEIDALLGISPN